MHRKAFLSLVASALLGAPLAAVAADINLNSADAGMLQKLDGVGAARAAAIVEYRDANGPFDAVAELVEVNGIGERTLKSNRERLTVE